ncbi:MAG: DPP IV N-terminal domain-containing protein [Bacteroidaceae bacterium]|nr:DPP IV N-terminal domain-containing protein [Bacteroidaceae bacterium]
MPQEKKSFTLHDLIPGGETYRQCTPANAWHTWWGDLCVELDVDTLTVLPPKGKSSATVLFTLDQVNRWLEAAGKQPVHTLQNVSFPYADKPLALLQSNDGHLLLDWQQGDVAWSVTFDRQAANRDWHKRSRHLAYTIGNNLCITTADGKTISVTSEPEGIKCGQAVHRNEFGIMSGTFWSADGQRLAFYRMDETMVSDYPQVDTEARTAEYQPDKYPMAGTASHKVTVGVHDIATGKTIYLQAGDPTDRYFSNIAWSPCARYIYLMEHPRTQDSAELVRYNALTGEKDAVLIVEKHAKYVEPMSPIIFLPWDDTKFIYQSQCDGFNHLYLYDVEGKELAQLTKGEWVVQELVGFREEGKEVIVATTEISPLQTNLYAVSVKTGKRRLLGNGEGVHSVQLSASSNWMIDCFSSPESPRCIQLVSLKSGKITKKLLDAPNPWDGFDAPEISVGIIKAADGVTDLYYRLVKPVGFDPAKKYPAVVYVYGGPHAQMIQNTWNYATRGWDIYMAQQGYVVFTVDNRGSSNRGLEFENCTYHQLGIEEMKDQLQGVAFLKGLPYVDADRLGVHGWSYGGFMTTNLMLTYPDVFKVGVAGGPVTDWKYYEVMYGERYMGTPQSNPEGYKNSSLLEKAGNLRGRLLVIHGGNDPVCVPQMTYSFLKACIDKGTHPDLFIYPGHGHNMLGRDRVHLHEHITRYFEDFLK